MKLPKLYELKRILTGKIFFGRGHVIKLPENSELIKSLPKLTDLVFDRKNSSEFDDANKLQLELKSLSEDLLNIKNKKK
ncbi:MAG: hypothetical protein KKG75_00200 [Nanoarchaeota archaeon]|nr:hypothetical protein [Nanoarchaeota archaeon]